MLSERRPQHRRYWIALIFLLLGLGTGAWHNRATQSGRADPTVTIVRGALAPPANALSRASRWVSAQTGWLFHGHAVADENRRLRERVAQLEGENVALREARIDYDRLHADLGFIQSSPVKLIPANIIGRRPDPKFDTFVLSVGTNNGVHVKSVVVTRSGVVGHVYEVTATTASVLMLTDQNTSVGVRVQRANSRATGVCKGDNSPLLTVFYLPPDADIKKDDVIVTSGLGGVYPPGRLVGTVLEVKEDKSSLLKRARVRPAVDFDRLEEVYVLP